MNETVQVLCDVGLDLGLPPSDSLSLAQWAAEHPGWLGELGNSALSEIPVNSPVCTIPAGTNSMSRLVAGGPGSSSGSQSMLRSRWRESFRSWSRLKFGPESRPLSGWWSWSEYWSGSGGVTVVGCSSSLGSAVGFRFRAESNFRASPPSPPRPPRPLRPR